MILVRKLGLRFSQGKSKALENLFNNQESKLFYDIPSHPPTTKFKFMLNE